MLNKRILTGIAVAVVVVFVATVGVTYFTDFSLPGSGLAGILPSGLGGADEETAHRLAGQQPNGVCADCHGDMLTGETPWHMMHLEKAFTAKLTCSECHKNIRKGDRTMDGKVLIDRKICTECHLMRFPAYNDDHKKSNWVKEHKKLRGDKTGGEDIFPLEVLEKKSEYKKCFICHNEKRKELNFCKDCHEFHEHSEDWINGKHGKQAKATNFECLRCHEKKTWCTTECHEGVTLPHNIPKWSEHWVDEPGEPKWRKIHYEEAFRLSDFKGFLGVKGNRLDRTKFTQCRRCHDSAKSEGENPDFCMQCHHDRFYKAYPELGVPWLENAMPFVKKHGSDQCWTCHLPEFCVNCHTTGMKAKPGATFVGWPD